MLRAQFIGSVAGVATFAIAGVSSASFSLSDLNVFIQTENGAISWSLANNPDAVISFEQVGENTYRLLGAWETANWSSDWDFLIRTTSESGQTRSGGLSEFVVSNFAFNNNTGATNNFIIGVTAATGSMGAPTGISGSVSGSLLSGNPGSSTATMSTFGGNSIYNAKMDGVVVGTLLDDPFSLSTMFTTGFGPAEFGIPTPDVGPALVGLIGIDHMFRLTNGDGVTFSSAFVVVPTPGAAGLLAMGGLLMLRRRR